MIDFKLFFKSKVIFQLLFLLHGNKDFCNHFRGEKSALVCQSKLFDDVNACLYRPGLLSFSVPCLITVKQ